MKGITSKYLLHLITHLFLLLFNMRTVTARRILISWVHVNARNCSKVILRSVLLLRSQYSFVKELSILACIKGIVLNIGLLPSESPCIFYWFEFILFINSIVILVVLVI